MRFWKKQAPSTDKGERIYAIGDIHGRYDLLKDVLFQIERHEGERPPARTTFMVLLGDLVDRGPQSAEVMRFLFDVQRTSRNMIVLQGNHEQMMVRALDGAPNSLRPWLRIGGDDTLRSFGLEPPARGDDEAAFLDRARRAIPREQIEWMRALPLTARSGDYFFCHAGIRPGVALKRQNKADLLWIRDEFLDDRSDHGAVVVHGHSVSAEVEIMNNRIGIDTGAYRTNILTAVCLDGAERHFFTARLEPVDGLTA